jgi:Ser/Thr protein kinase RdoA (MazF antagonist)
MKGFALKLPFINRYHEVRDAEDWKLIFALCRMAAIRLMIAVRRHSGVDPISRHSQ